MTAFRPCKLKLLGVVNPNSYGCGCEFQPRKADKKGMCISPTDAVCQVSEHTVRRM